MNSTAHEKIDPMPIGNLGMWFFLASETMFFVGLLGAFIVLKSAGGQQALFTESATKLSNTLGLASASLLITSSAAFRRKTILPWIAIAASVLFLISQAMQWRTLLLTGNGPSQNNFFGCYFLLSSTHALHAVAGIVAVAWLTTFAKSNWPDAIQMYWHFVNVVGAVTLAALYFA